MVIDNDALAQSVAAAASALASLAQSICETRNKDGYVISALDRLSDISASMQKSKKRPTSLPASGETTPIYIYLAASRGLAAMANLAREAGVEIVNDRGERRRPFFVKAGTTTEPDLAKRLREVGAERYGAVVRDGETFVVEPGFDAWVAQPITTRRASSNPAISVLPRAISVQLPASMTPRSFDSALRRALAPRSLHRADHGRTLYPGPERHTSYAMGGTARVSRAMELVALSPRDPADGDMLIAAVETILRQHPGGR